MQIRLLQTIASFAVPDLILRGADWYHSTVAPCCRALYRRDSARVSRNLACDVLLLQGDLLFVLGAYRAALQAYRDACNFSPENPDAVQGADDAQHALRAFRSTLRFKVHEALVERNLPRLATLLSKSLAIDDRLQVLSVLGRDAEAINAIRRDISAGGEISFGAGTWFYVSRAIADDWRFWELLLKNAEQILGLMLPSCVEGESLVWPTGARIRNYRLSVRARKAALTLHFARATNRPELLDQLTAMYPEWLEPRLLLRWHAKQGRMPRWHEMGDVSEWMRRNRR